MRHGKMAARRTKAPSTNIQAPEKLQIPITSPGSEWCLRFGTWCFHGAWMLELGAFLVHSFHNRLLHRSKRTHFSDSIPGVRTARRPAQGFISFQKSRHEKLFGQGCELDPPPFAIVDAFFSLLWIDHTQHSARLRGIVRN